MKPSMPVSARALARAGTALLEFGWQFHGGLAGGAG
jgi:hypothetical protein